MAAGPVHLLEAGVVTEQRFAALGGAPAALSPAVSERVRPDKKVRIPFNPRDRWLTAARETCRTVAEAVKASLASGATPVVLGGECTIVAGTISGALDADADLSLVYFDAHGDFNTLATTPTHYVAGMCLAHVCGRRIAPLLWPGARTISDDRVALVGGRALDPGEAGNLSLSRVTRVPFDREHADAPGLLAFARRRSLWVHVDVDIADPADVPAVVYPVPGGPHLARVADVLRSLAAVATIRGVELCGYDPHRDEAGTLLGPLADLAAAALPARAPAVAR